jgi:hypothetical protein
MKTEIGVYEVNNKIYASKFDAVMAAQLTNSEVRWNFFNDELSKANWTIEPQLSLDELYKMRAKQIRDKYDYIIVFCSGGADSTNVIRSFINNNIHVDEVMALAPMSGLKNYDFNKNDQSEDNTISETKFALFPLLNEIASKNSNIKITINDFFEEMISYKDEDWTYNACGNIVTVLTSHFTNVGKFKHIDALIQQGKKIGLVYGTDKPVIRITPDGDLVFVLADAGINYLNMPADRENLNIDRVLFYWTPDLPEIMIKQCHVVAKAMHLPGYQYIQELLRTDPKILSDISFQQRIDYQIQNNITVSTKEKVLEHFLPTNNTSDKTLKFSSKTIYQRAIVPFIYPTTYEKDLFQCQKVNADAGFFTRDQAWLYEQHSNTRISEMVLHGVVSLYNSINPKYLNINGTGFINNYQVYKFGHIFNFRQHP